MYLGQPAIQTMSHFLFYLALSSKNRYASGMEPVMKSEMVKDTVLDIGIDEECPICAKLRDPKTGAPPFNAKVLAAMEESKAAMRGEIPAKGWAT